MRFSSPLRNKKMTLKKQPNLEPGTKLYLPFTLDRQNNRWRDERVWVKKKKET